MVPQVSKNSVEHLYAALDELRPLQRIVLYLRFWENREITEIARLTRRPWTDIDLLIEITLVELRHMLGPMPGRAETKSPKTYAA